MTDQPAVEPDPWAVTAPGLVDGMPADTYHADPCPTWSLSSTGARDLTPPGVPARYFHDRTHPRPPKKAFDVGHAAHTKVLGVGAEYVVPVDEDGEPWAEWRTNHAKDQVAEIRAAGYIPLTADEAAQVEEMAEQLLAHPIARALLEETAGRPEVSAFAVDPVAGCWLRARFDWLPATDGGRLIFGDYKTTVDASDQAMAKAIADWQLHQQGDFYRHVALTLRLAEQVGFVLIAQEKSPPYLVNVVTPDADAMRNAALLNRRAIDLFADCLASGRWPGYGEEIRALPLPAYQAIREQELINS